MVNDYINAFLDALGVKAGVVMAGLGGAVARIAFFGVNGSGAISAVFSVIGGMVTAIYLGPVIPGYLNWPSTGQSTLAATFIVGVFGMEICKKISAALSRWTPTITKGPKDA